MSEFFLSGELLRDAGIATVLENNAAYRKRFASAAEVILGHEREVTSDAVVRMIGMPSGHPNAVGGAMRSFAIANSLAVRRYIKTTRPSGHARIIAVWGK